MTSIRETFLPDEGEVFVRADLCLTGDTLIETLQGAKPIRKIKRGDKVFTFRDCRVAWGEVAAKKMTGVCRIWKVTLDDHSIIRGTSEHRFLVIRHWGGNSRGKPKIEEVCLSALKPGNRLVPLRKTIQLGYEILYSRSSFEYSKTHQLVAEAYLGSRPDSFETHHIDGDKLNNNQKNLRYEQKRKHNSLHAKESFARVDQEKRVRRLRKALKSRDLTGEKNGMFGVRRFGKDNPNYGNRKGFYKVCPVCEAEFYVKPSDKDRIYCKKACFVAVQRGLNHTVLRVEQTDYVEKVWSITVEPDHNYALSCGVFVRNSQIEDRVCKMYCGTERMVELANRRPEVYDAHTHNASIIFGKGHGEITKDERYLGKKVVHGCVDKQTEVLTRRGFVKIPLLTTWDEVAQWDIETKEITFVKPKAFIVKNYTGCLLRFREGFVSQLVTEDHRMVYNSNGALKVVKAADFPKSGGVPLNGFYSGGVKLNSAFVCLLAAFQADGSVDYKHRAISWHLKKDKKIERLRWLFGLLGYNYTEIAGKERDVYLRLNQQESKELLYWLPNKKYSTKLLEIEGSSLDVLLNELQYWDGEKRNNCESIQYRSTDLDNVNWIQIIAHLRGKKASIVECKKGKGTFLKDSSVLYHLNINDFKFSKIVNNPHTEHKVDFPVYCLTVDTGFFVMRRNGCVSITGNSQRGLRGERMSESISHDTKSQVFVHPKRCDTLIDKYLDNMWEIRDIYFPWVRQQIADAGFLYNSWGRRFDVRTRRIDDDLNRECYSWYMQSECADWCNQYGWIPVSQYMMARFGKPASAQVHDEVIVSVGIQDAYEAAFYVVSCMEQTREIPAGSGRMLTVPAEVTIGRSWGDKEAVEFKKLPDRGGFYNQLKQGGFQC